MKAEILLEQIDAGGWTFSLLIAVKSRETRPMQHRGYLARTIAARWTIRAA